MELSEIIRSTRYEKKLSVYALAEESGLSRAYITKLEHGKSAPTIDSLRKLAKPLGYSLVEIIEMMESHRKIYKTNLSEVEERISKDKSFLSYPLNVRTDDRSIEIFKFRFISIGEHQAIRPRGARVNIFLSKGELSFKVNDDLIILKEGDFIQVTISNQYRYIQKSKKLAEGMVVIRHP